MPQINSQSATSQAIAASALRAQQARMRIIAENIANADSTARTPGGDPYRRQTPIFEPAAVGGGAGVRLARVEPDQKAFKSEYNPGHPGADEQGYVKMPNVETLVESLDMRAAQRAYEANLNVIETARSIDSKTLEILKR
ncbi:flagellar basal body rod protein FlgC [Caulobacter sp. NIBR2454]|uniref:flagellar basal body rod protein FlgC n=1 Tax=Caulobacter sp. NIBR2454 TaxID=3015996 RepID=UPI0022B6C0CD|nr:flagellar basal body rod protein FlgC [Caulobacter sp. NIBR2454]